MNYENCTIDRNNEEISPAEFLKLSGAAEKIEIFRLGNSFRLYGTFNLGGQRKLSLRSGIFKMVAGRNKLLGGDK